MTKEHHEKSCQHPVRGTPPQATPRGHPFVCVSCMLAQGRFVLRPGSMTLCSLSLPFPTKRGQLDTLFCAFPPPTPPPPPTPHLLATSHLKELSRSA